MNEHPDGLGLVTNIYVVSYPKDQGRVMYDQLRIPFLVMMDNAAMNMDNAAICIQVFM